MGLGDATAVRHSSKQEMVDVADCDSDRPPPCSSISNGRSRCQCLVSDGPWNLYAAMSIANQVEAHGSGQQPGAML